MPDADLGFVLARAPRHRETFHPLAECVLRNDEGQRAYVQVKSSSAAMTEPIEVLEDVDVFYLFDAAEVWSAA